MFISLFWAQFRDATSENVTAAAAMSVSEIEELRITIA
jgi:hypothetical protein